MKYLSTALLTSLIILTACAHNPVSGKKEFSIISERQEQEIGKTNYQTMIQAQGGPYTQDPELVAYVQSVGKKLAAVSHRPHLDYEFVILNDSVPNAWALPGGKVAINRGLLVELSSEAELAAVLGHEITHAVARHGAKGLERGLLLQGSVVALGVALDDKKYSDILVTGASVGAMLVQQKYSRMQELEADRLGMSYMNRAGFAPDAAVTLQETFLRLSKDKKSVWIDSLFASHPPSQERIDTNKETLATMQAKSEFYGREEYLEKISNLQKQQEAYKAHDEAKRALSEKNIHVAKEYIKQALLSSPQEALFWQTLGDLHMKERDQKRALTAYSRAIELNPNYFQPYLKRSKIYARTQEYQLATQDAKASVALLATGDGHELLGQLYLIQDNKPLAQHHLQIASRADSKAGKRARNTLTRLSE